MQYNKLIEGLQPSRSIVFMGKAKQLQAKDSSVISLAGGEPDFDTPKAICEELNRQIAAGYTHLNVTLTGDLGSAQIWYGDDDWGDGEIAVNAKNFVNGSYTFEIDLTTFKPNENFTMMVNAAKIADLLVKIEPIAE